MTKPTILQILNERIISLEKEIHMCDALLDDINVPSKTKTGRDLALSARLQWLSSYVQHTFDHKRIVKLDINTDNPIFFSNN